jgi:hypothetical protein
MVSVPRTGARYPECLLQQDRYAKQFAALQCHGNIVSVIVSVATVRSDSNRAVRIAKSRGTFQQEQSV